MHASASGALATTDFTILERVGEAVLVEARPGTGRKHQIRAHLAGSRAPILGDSRYGGPMQSGRCRAGRVMLHAARLSLRHPVTDVPLTITCPYPADFEELLACLRRSAPRRP
jgi:23S rRNA-/tRNA-specific pseudouridylate synthase